MVYSMSVFTVAVLFILGVFFIQGKKIYVYGPPAPGSHIEYVYQGVAHYSDGTLGPVLEGYGN